MNAVLHAQISFTFSGEGKGAPAALLRNPGAIRSFFLVGPCPRSGTLPAGAQAKRAAALEERGAEGEPIGSRRS